MELSHLNFDRGDQGMIGVRTVQAVGPSPLNALPIEETAAAPLGEWSPDYSDLSAASASRAKRLMDIVIAAGALVFFLPLMLVIALLIRLESKGPALFRQTRGGLRQAPFEIYKFRTMQQIEDGPAISHAKRNDPRVTSIGGFLRRSSLDELPQLLNVLKGDMSIVGPRPHAVAHDDYYGRLIPCYRARMRAKPGLTGLAQVTGYRGNVQDLESMAARVARDLDYIENWSLQLDLKLILITIVRLPFDQQAF